jgi:hypothetical protein
MSKSKFNWGTGILITIIVFMVITISTVVYLMNQDVDLVAKDYYDKGIHHQEQIDRINRANAIGDEVSINLENGFIKLTFPKAFVHEKISGSIQFYRPSDSKRDFTVPLTIDTNAQQIILTKSIDKGYWKVELNWTQDSLEYYKESSIVIN